ncbi:hypothetical protein MPSEU_000384800 [Mayamaea pseudoterrestris]|nr:hypothetical protein MPSEU_000384800 [Mayamaea pseudoterrestris]
MAEEHHQDSSDVTDTDPVYVIKQQEASDYEGDGLKQNDSDPEYSTNPAATAARHAAMMRRASLDAAPYDVSYRPSLLLLYSKPQQRQTWNDAQVLPRVDWGDVFFDLFYVGATYNVSNILNVTPTGRGLLYAMATFFALMNVWNEKLMYDCRFVYQGDDVFHRLAQVSLFLMVATAVLNIRPIDELIGQRRLFVFCLALVLERVLNLARYLEIYVFGVGQVKQMRHVAISASRNTCIGLVFYLAAAIVAWNMVDLTASSSHRLLVEEAITIRDDLSIILVLCGFLAQHIVQNIHILFFFPSGDRHKELTIPLNVGFTVHRNGEWVMLMLGESIFSILIVYVSDQSSWFYRIFYCGLLMVVLLQYLHFMSLPRDAVNDHALRRSKDAGILWSNLHIIYSFALVSFGATFTTFLLDELHQSTEETRRLSETVLVGDPDVRRQQNANLFAGSLAVIFFCLDTMILAHIGLGKSKGRCVCRKSKHVNVRGVLLLSLRAGLLAFTATLGLWVVDPANLAIIGLVCVLAQLVSRKLGLKFLSREFEGADDGSVDESARWPNVTSAQAEHHHH